MNRPDPVLLRQIRIILCAAVIVLGFGLLIIRLWQVQILQGVQHQQKTQRQSIRPVLLNPARGRIVSADGRVLADSISHYDFVAHVSEMRQPGRPANTIRHIISCERMMAMTIGRPAALTEETVKKHLYRHPVMPLVLFKSLTPEELTRTAEFSPPIPGLEIVPRIERDYPLPGIGTHFLGLTGKKLLNPPDIGEDFSRIYVSPELIGRSGLESHYNQVLSGKPGSRLVKVDSQGYVFQDVREPLRPRHGSSLILSIDSNAQQAADGVLQGHTGALVVLSVRTGGVLAMASAPTYSLEGLSQRKYAAFLRDKAGKPLLNRAVDGQYTPGSIVKPLIALAVLERCGLDPEQPYECTGVFKVGNHPIRCAKRSGHGELNLSEAITFSCNPYFMAAGCEAGVDELAPYFAAAGFGEKTGIDLWEAVRGIAPSREYVQRRMKRPWRIVDTAYASIGQGIVGITPLQAAVYTAALANGGIIYKPYLVETILGEDGQILRQTAPVIRHRIPASMDHFQLVRKGMEAVAADPAASAYALTKAGFSVAAKTGTAEVGSGSNRKKDTWVICYGPVENPEFALACLIEDGDSGGKTAVPVVVQFLRNWLEAGREEFPR